MIGGIVKPTDAQGTSMAGTDRPASPVCGGAGGAAIGRHVTDRQRLATLLDGGFKDSHGRRLARMSAGVKGNPASGRPMTCGRLVPEVLQIVERRAAGMERDNLRRMWRIM